MIDCYKCNHVITKSDGAGGGIVQCEKLGGVVLGEYGHWTDENDDPTTDTCIWFDPREKR